MHLRASLVFASIVALLLPFAAAADSLFRGGSKTSPVKSDAQRDVIAGRQFRVKRDGDNCVSISGKEFAERVNLVPDPAYDMLTVNTCKKVGSTLNCTDFCTYNILSKQDIETWLANDSNGQALTRLMGIDAARTGVYRLVGCLFAARILTDWRNFQVYWWCKFGSPCLSFLLSSEFPTLVDPDD